MYKKYLIFGFTVAFLLFLGSEKTHAAEPNTTEVPSVVGVREANQLIMAPLGIDLRDIKGINIYKNNLYATTITEDDFLPIIWDSNLREDKTYVYKITTVNKNNVESKGKIFRYKPIITDSKKKPVTELWSFELPMNNERHFSWKNPIDSNFDYVEIYRNDELIGKTSKEEYTDDKYEEGKNHSYYLIAVYKDKGKSLPAEYSNSFWSGDEETAVKSPNNIRMSLNEARDTVTINWNKPNDDKVAGYNIYAANVDQNGIVKKVNTDLIKTTNYSYTYKGNDNFVFYTVSVDKNGKESPFSIEDNYSVGIVSFGEIPEVVAGIEQIMNDVVADHWAIDDMDFVHTKGWMNGRTKETFNPNDTFTRAEAAATFVRVLNLKEKNAIKKTFKDVPTDYWAYKDIEIAHQHGLFAGKGENKFSPKDPIRRDEFAVVLHRILADKTVKTPSKSPFKDVKTDYWAYKEIANLKEMNIFGGYSDNTFRTKGNITRAEVSALLQRSAEKLEKTE